MVELKPCPFCGGAAHVDLHYSYFRDFVIYCEGCGTVFGLDDWRVTEAETIDAWNRRHNDAD